MILANPYTYNFLKGSTHSALERSQDSTGAFSRLLWSVLQTPLQSLLAPLNLLLVPMELVQGCQKQVPRLLPLLKLLEVWDTNKQSLTPCKINRQDKMHQTFFVKVKRKLRCAVRAGRQANIALFLKNVKTCHFCHKTLTYDVFGPIILDYAPREFFGLHFHARRRG